MRNLRWQLFLMGLWLGTTVFGGGGQAYPIIRQHVSKRGWLPAEEVDAMYPLAAFMPGPTFLNLLGAVAGRIGGFWGAVAGQVGLMLPSVLLVLGLPLLTHIDFISQRTNGVMLGTASATVGLLLAAGLQEAGRLGPGAGWFKAVTALVLLVLGVHPLLLLMAGLAWGAIGISNTAQREGV